ncbi:hypothetical protein [Candidatus Borreliella tachyglossi]|uniref:hypothetical protein n=1 Tax=Candidatus Borreliella tachyglossi TaxID=1964448 RepID=UPI0040414DD1
MIISIDKKLRQLKEISKNINTAEAKLKPIVAKYIICKGYSKTVSEFGSKVSVDFSIVLNSTDPQCFRNPYN